MTIRTPDLSETEPGLTLRGDNWFHVDKRDFDRTDPRLTDAFSNQALETLNRWLAEGQRSRIDAMGKYLVAVFLIPVMQRDEDLVWEHKLVLLATHDTVLTVADSPAGRPPLSMSEVARSFRADPGVDPGTLTYFVIDDIASAFLQVIEDFEAEVNEVEDKIESVRPHRTADTIWFRNRLRRFRNDVHLVRKALLPLIKAVHFIVDKRTDLAGKELFPEELEMKLKDTSDRLLYAAESLEAVRDELGGLRDFIQAKVANEQNEIMKTLTIVASVVLIPTLIVGVFGQNFENMPGSSWEMGFWSIMAVILIIVGIELWLFWMSGWIGRGRSSQRGAVDLTSKPDA